MTCGCPAPTFKESVPIESLLSLTGKFALPSDLEEPDTLLGINVRVVTYPEFGGRRLDDSENGGSVVSIRYFNAGWIAFGRNDDYFMREIEIDWDKNFFLVPPNCTHVRYWLSLGVQIDVDKVVGTCPEDEEL